MHLHALDYVLWVSTVLVQSSVLLVLYGRGLGSPLPFFAGYILYQVISDTVLLAVRPLSYTAYYYAYWSGVALSILFTFALIDELFRLAFRNFSAIRNLGTRVFRWAAALVVFFEVVSLVDVNGYSLADFAQRILMLDRAARILLCSLAILLLFGAGFLRISPRSLLFGIALGFAFYTSSRAMVESAFLDQIASRKFLMRGNSFVYLATCLLWLGYAAYADPLPASALTNQEDWDETDTSEAGQNTLLEVINAVVERSMGKERQNS